VAANLESIQTISDYCKGVVATEMSTDRFETLDTSEFAVNFK
jgi:hypothetical protein